MKQVIQYQANDGKVFSTEHACELYEMLGSDSIFAPNGLVNVSDLAGELNRNGVGIVASESMNDLMEALATFSVGPIYDTSTNTNVVNAVVDVLNSVCQQMDAMRDELSKQGQKAYERVSNEDLLTVLLLNTRND